jgi:HBS1 N-terminus
MNSIVCYLLFHNVSIYIHLTGQMVSGLRHVRNVLGSEEESGLDDKIIQDSLWDLYFDVERTIEWLLGGCNCVYLASLINIFPEEQRKRQAARDRKGE